jgi:hypothetical protein
MTGATGTPELSDLAITRWLRPSDESRISPLIVRFSVSSPTGRKLQR